MTTANKITIFRILLIPFFAYEVLTFRDAGRDVDRWLAMSAFFIAAVLDGVDGYVARRFHQRSELGAVLDPLADKLLLVCALVLLSLDHPHFEPVPLWLLITIISRDLFLLAGALLIYITCGQTRVRPRMSGKISTVLQMAVVLWTMLQWNPPIGTTLAAAAAAFTGFSGLQYLMDGIRQLSESPVSGPAPDQ